MDISLLNKNAMVCGSTSGIRKSCAILLAKLGANITLVARNEEKLKETLILLDMSQDQKHNYLVADFSNTEEVRKKANAAVDNRIYQILINNTGGPKGGPMFSAETKEFSDAFS